MDDPREIFLEKFDLKSSRVIFSTSPIVLLCGGPFAEEKKDPDDSDLPIKSLRDALKRQAIRTPVPFEIYLPEDIDGWHKDGIYKNLIEFEKDMAGICSLVQVVLESAGSIAELAAFSQLPELSRRMMVVKSSLNDNTSFINLGILRYIEEDPNGGWVNGYPWEVGKPDTITDEIVDDILFDVKANLDKLHDSEVVNTEKNTHIFVITCMLLQSFIALKETEILDYLKRLNFKISKQSLSSKLFLLEEFRLIKRVQYSDSKFFIKTNETFHKTRLAAFPPHTIDDIRIKSECSEYYRNNSKVHRNRLRAIQVMYGDSSNG